MTLKQGLATLITCSALVVVLPIVSFAKDEPAGKGAAAPTIRTEAQRVAGAAAFIREIANLQKRKIPPVLFDESTALLIVPKAAKNAFMVKGGAVEGILLARDNAGNWSGPLFVTMSGGTLGWQIVGDPMDILLIYRNNRSVEALLKGKVHLNVKVNIVPGRVAPTMKGATREVLEAEITSYVRSHGAFAEDGVVAGTTLQINHAANDAYYGRTKTDAAAILDGTVTKKSDDLAALHKTLKEYAALK